MEDLNKPCYRHTVHIKTQLWGQEAAGCTRQMSVLFTHNITVKFVIALNEPPLTLKPTLATIVVYAFWYPVPAYATIVVITTRY